MAPRIARSHLYLLVTGASRLSGWGRGLDGVQRKCLVPFGIILLLGQAVLAAEDEANSSEHLPLPQGPAASLGVSASLPPMEEVVATDVAWPGERNREQAVFSSVLTLLASTDVEPQTLVELTPSSDSNSDNQTSQRPSEDLARNTDASYTALKGDSVSVTSSDLGVPSGHIVEEPVSGVPQNPDLPTALSSLVEQDMDPSLQKSVVDSLTPDPQNNSAMPDRANIISSTTPASETSPNTVTSDSLQLTTVTTTTVTPLTVTTTTVTFTETSIRTIEPLPSTKQATKTTQTPTVPTTKPPSSTSTSASTTASTTTPDPTTTTTAPTQPTHGPTSRATNTEVSTVTSATVQMPCNVTERMLIKTVLSIQMKRNKLERLMKLNLSRGLSQALQRAFNDSTIHAQVERDVCNPSNVTLGYYVAAGKTVYMTSVVLEALNAYGLDKLLSDFRQYVPEVEAVPIPVAPWMESLGIHLQLKTVLRFVSPTDNIMSCGFRQMMEQRLENVFIEAQEKVENTYGTLTVEILNTYQVLGTPSVSIVYVVRNGSSVLNGTISSMLLNQLSAELVGYFLYFPPLIIAEPLEYHNLNTSVATRDYWVITVIQDVDSSSLEASYQSFSSLMEQRLAELFLVASRHGLRYRRATTVGGYTVQMVNIRRLPGPKNPAKMTYYIQQDGAPIVGTSAAKTLNTVDSQTMALSLGYFVQLQAEPVVKSVPSNMWILAVLTPVSLVMVIVVMAIAIVCRKNRSVFKTSAFRSFHPRTKPVQGFDYAKKHMGRTGDEPVSVTKETLVLSLPVRDAPLSQERAGHQDGTVSKRPPSTDLHKRLPSEEDSVSSNESGKLNTGRSSSMRRTAAQKSAKDETHTRCDPYDSLTGSLRVITIKPMTAPPTYSYPASSNHSQDSAGINGEVSMGLKQKSDIERYRNKLRLKAKRKGYGEAGVSTSGSSGGSGGGSGHACNHWDRHRRDNAPLDLQDVLEPAGELNPSTYVKYHRSDSHSRDPAYWSRQSLNSPSPVETEMDLLVMSERSRRGIRNSGYDGEPEPFEETDVDQLMTSLGFGGGVGMPGKGHSDSSTLSSQPSIDEVRQQMHLLLDNAFGLATAEPTSGGGHHHHPHSLYNTNHNSLYSDGVTSAPGTMNHPSGGLQRGSSFAPEMHQCSLPKPGFRFTQLPDMGLGSPPPLITPRSGTTLRRSSPDVTMKPRVSEASDMQIQHNGAPYLPINRAPFPAVTVDQSITSYSGNPMTAVYAISANRPGYSDYFVLSPPSSYRSPSWMSYPPEPEDLPHHWNDSNQCHLETIC
ncbi:UPF0606 protein KIAA1549L isoform X2 [Denticeps clupeoides]|uniref:UPF0606 protein KIAA1549L isoform X2 n=1 Tax=Denticeps clupeoides TaxID=299321 RepID=UPI0010A368AA|nr:UPF0606 protein KIAA1549L-like isoform X2 [Denticeps clupeoides]